MLRSSPSATSFPKLLARRETRFVSPAAIHLASLMFNAKAMSCADQEQARSNVLAATPNTVQVQAPSAPSPSRSQLRLGPDSGDIVAYAINTLTCYLVVNMVRKLASAGFDSNRSNALANGGEHPPSQMRGSGDLWICRSAMLN